MDWLNAVVEVMKALAWPALILIVFFLFRQPLRALMKALTKQIEGAESVEVSGSVGTLKTELRLKQATAAIELLQLPEEPKPALKIERGSAPKAVVDRAEDLESALVSFAERHDIHHEAGGNPLNTSRLLAGALLSEGSISGEIYNAVDILCDLLEESAQRSLSEQDDETVNRLLTAVLSALESLDQRGRSA